MGECNKETTFAMLDFFYENGGNFIDTYVDQVYRRPVLPQDHFC